MNKDKKKVWDRLKNGITKFPAPLAGSISFDTNTNTFKLYTGNEWVEVAYNEKSKMFNEHFNTD